VAAQSTPVPPAGYLSQPQIDILLRPIHPRRVAVRQGLSYVEGYDIRAELNRVFGFGRWSTTILGQTLIAEDQVEMNNKRPGWNVIYRTSLRLIVRNPDGSLLAEYEEAHVGESTHPVRGEAHGNALTNSTTYALKRCAINLGDQFGLSLYGKGSMDALVRWTLVRPEAGEAKVDTDDVAQVVPEGEQIASAEHTQRPERGNHSSAPAGRTVRPARQPEDTGDAVDPEAQELARLGDEAPSVEGLRAVYSNARAADKLRKNVLTSDATLVSLDRYLRAIRDKLTEAAAA
jgi:hypothetical protein